MSDLVL